MELLPQFCFAGVFVASACISFAAAFMMRRVAVRCGILATPGGHRRHENGTPLLGGAGLYIALMLACLCAATGTHEDHTLILFAGITSFYFAIGIWDDCHSLGGFTKLLFQIPATGVYVWLGLGFSFVGAPHEILLGGLALFWILTVANGMNFIDGVDGLCSGIAFLMSMCLAAILISWGHAASPYVLVTLGLAGATLAFLTINMRPALMFLGDSGSLLLGCALATVSLLFLQMCPPPVSSGLEGMVLCFMIPIADCALTVLRRLRLRRPLFESDWGHIHHRLMETGLKYAAIVRILWGVQAVFCVLAWLASTASPAFRHIWICVGMVFALILYGGLLLRERHHAKSV